VRRALHLVVGAGAARRDLLGAGVIPSVRLTHIVRQAHRAAWWPLPTASTPAGCP
jgi:hypothetical protein